MTFTFASLCSSSAAGSSSLLWSSLYLLSGKPEVAVE